MRLILLVTATIGLVGGAAWAAAGDNVADPVFPQALRAAFDRPQSKTRTLVPAREPGDPRGAVRCFRYPAFLVKEVDYGEHGDDHVSVTPLAAAAAMPACAVAALPGEIVLTSSEEGYFLGASGRYGFVESTEGQDGTPVTIHELTSGQAVYADNMAIDTDRFAVAGGGGGLSVEYTRAASGDCSIASGGAACWKAFAVRAQLPPELAAAPAPIAACLAGYAPAKGDRRGAPSVLRYRMTLTIDPAGKQAIRSGAIVGCTPQS